MLGELKLNYRTQLTKKWSLQDDINNAIDVASVDLIVW